MCVKALVHVAVERVSTGPSRNSAGPLELHVVQHERGADKRVCFGACCKLGSGGALLNAFAWGVVATWGRLGP